MLSPSWSWGKAFTCVLQKEGSSTTDRQRRLKTHVVCLSPSHPFWDYCCNLSGCQHFTRHLMVSVAAAPFQLASTTWSFFRPSTLKTAASRMGLSRMPTEKICLSSYILTGVALFFPQKTCWTSQAVQYDSKSCCKQISRAAFMCVIFSHVRSPQNSRPISDADSCEQQRNVVYLYSQESLYRLSPWTMRVCPFCRSLNVYSGVKGYPELQCLSIASQTTTLESIVISPDYFTYQVSRAKSKLTEASWNQHQAQTSSLGLQPRFLFSH